ncbi:hypothetical protein ACIPW5_24120 [Streptomyces sp. NPDC090077]|uniref:hypothetical protein n=1 Tax=Streptomyces sp. NPDC090077 TaxID=3365938 RepID=UPI0037F91F13
MPKENPRKGTNGQLGTTAALLALALAVANAQLTGPALVAVMAVIGIGLVACAAKVGANVAAGKR